MKRWIMVGLLVLATGCAKGKFQGMAGAREDASDETNVGITPGLDDSKYPARSEAFNEILDLAKLDKNADKVAEGGPTAGTIGNIQQPLDLSCELTPEYTISVGPTDDLMVAPNTRTALNLKGRFCPTISDNLTVLFIIDFSGSMGPGGPNPATLGNDPRATINGQPSCGRLLAVEAIMNKFLPEDNVNVGLVTFASDLIPTYSAAPVDQKAFRTSKLDAATKLNNFCSYVAPSPEFATNPMAIPNAMVEGGTNYAAAFAQATTYLQKVGGRKAIYFITDGRPTIGQDPVALAKEAAAELKKVDNLYFNAFFLQNKAANQPEDTIGFNTLIDIVGAKERVVKADSAEQLAIAVAKEQTAQFDPASIQASLTIAPYKPEEPLKIISFQQDPNNPKAWMFETQAFLLDGIDKTTVEHLVQVNALTLDKTKLSSKVKILYNKNP